MRLASISTKNLLGRFDYEIELDSVDGITILTAPNGFGKSTLLQLVNSVLSGELALLRSVPFEQFRLNFNNDQFISFSRSKVRISSELILEFNLFNEEASYKLGSRNLSYRTIDTAELAEDIDNFLPNLRRINADTWLDIEEGTYYDSSEVILRFGDKIGYRNRNTRSSASWVRKLKKSLPVLSVPADRLHVTAHGHYQNDRFRNQIHLNKSEAVDEINHILVSQISLSLQKYANTSHAIDGAFLATILPKINRSKTPTQRELGNLKKQEELVKSLESRFQSLGLLDSSSRVKNDAAPSTGPALVVLQTHYKDVLRKLSELEALANKMELLHEILNKSYSFKNIEFNRRTGIRLTTDEGKDLNLQSLSSGEQHLLVLFGRLLFKDRSPLVLLDEPEISLHLEWQQGLLDYMRRVSLLEPFDLLVATHSPSLINGRWHLTRELAEQYRK